MDITKYKPSAKVLDKLENYRKKGSRVNVKAITDLNKLFTYYYAGTLMGWGELTGDIWSISSSNERGVLKLIDDTVSKDSSLADVRSKDEINLQNLSKKIAAFLAENKLTYTFTERTPFRDELEMDRRNGRCYTISYTLSVDTKSGSHNIYIANHTNEGGGTYGYDIRGILGPLTKAKLEELVIKEIQNNCLTESCTFAEDFKLYEDLWK